MNFKQDNSVLAAEAVAAQRRVCVCIAAHSLILLLGPGSLRHKAGQVESELARRHIAALLYILIRTVGEGEFVPT